MSDSAKMPEEARPVAEYIRKVVPRPKLLPKMVCFSAGLCALRWRRKRKRWGKATASCCPLGLCPQSVSPAPSPDLATIIAVPGTLNELGCFVDWWDSLTAADAQEAVNEIWGTDE